MIGELLDRRYRVDAPIARGGMSTVYRGIDTRLDRPVAIKVMDAQYAADPAFVARFEFEARSVARLKHPALVAVYDQGHDLDHAFLVMELVEGGTLRELLRERGPMPPHAVNAVVAPVLDALAVAHRAGLVHRDVKPENILISESGEVKIADFGLVRAAAAASTTSHSVILGTAAYLSPEQVTTGVAEARSDVYSAGILMFELLTGHTPFRGDTSLSVAYQRVNQDVPRPGSFIAGVPLEFDELVAEATHREPTHRFDDAGAMAAALRATATALDLPDYRVPAPRRPVPPAAVPSIGGDGATTNLAASTQVVTAPPRPHDEHPQPTPHHTRVVTALTPRPPEWGGGPPEPPYDDPHDGPDDGDSGGPPRGRFGYTDFEAERRKSRRSMALWLLVVVTLALAVGLGGWWMGSGRFTAVPSLDGLDPPGAVAAVEAAGLQGEIRGEYSDSAAVDTVLGTDPPPGARISRDGTVAVLVSLGRPSVPTLPSGGDRSQVEQGLRERTLEPAEGGEVFSARIPVGGVAALDPAPGTTVPVGSRVELVFSKGAPPVEIPDVTGLPEDEARAALDAVGITVTQVRTEFDPEVAAGRASATAPEIGSTVDAGTGVTLVVSDAVRVPSMLGRSVGSAREELTRLGLDVQIRQVAETDRSLVVSQSPGGGDLVRPGTTITLVSVP
ncbi:PASTA domain-containing protein [Rhodococcus triatomae]|uniref:non-specific serine/threonine protein kinase n=1 Tax=Rhodococcus triatomae TaxID=300028 RepID=A0A1G8D3Z0_9NOCA|nr:Stk1 family PASTA domain-containing Ser/Thr kinase [Rhodococcus triatomae]QNG18514.1 PASTA domain-containing protein [Rhodococcus triatomae]QNG21817.1 PASTA domain-containing protein [Rhodococcus triatomae]SDH52456.1 serine/threonine protein kinase [Rhodococcus triatomae]